MPKSSTPFDSSEPQTSLMSRVIESGSALIATLKGKLLGTSLLGPGEDSLRRAHKALDSTKINIRLLAGEAELPAIRQIAETTDEPELASFAVSYLAEHQNEAVLPQLQHLARSNSFACLPALISLFNNGQIGFAQALLAERLANGDYFNLIKNSKARPLLLLDILGAVDEFNKSTLCLQHFPKIWLCLSERPQDQEKLLAEMLGDVNPGGVRFAPDNNMIPQAVKIQAMQLLHAIRPPSYQRSLWYASRDCDDSVAYTATMACMQFWQSDGKVPDDLEPFAMLNLNLLFHLSKIASAFKWRDSAGVGDMYTQWQVDLEQLAQLNPGQEQQKHLYLKKKTEKTDAQLSEIAARRLNDLQPVVDAVTTSLGLPHAKIRSTDVAGVSASYLVGTGTVEFSKSTLLDDKPLSEEFMSSMLHELAHMEQDVLIIKMIADLLGLQFGQHGKQLNELFQHYAEAIGYAPDSIFLLEVLRLRRDKLLSEGEKKRAERLVNAAYDNFFACQQAEKLAERIERIEESVAGIESGSYDLHLLECLRDEQSLKPLFENGYVPGVLIDEIRNCKSSIEEAVSAVTGQRRGRGDSIAVAREMISAGADREQSPVMPVIERFRIVVSHMLIEEQRRLDRELSEIRRAGYHEAEAYAISDRVEVIVRALRKGWYQFTS